MTGMGMEMEMETGTATGDGKWWSRMEKEGCVVGVFTGFSLVFGIYPRRLIGRVIVIYQEDLFIIEYIMSPHSLYMNIIG